MKKFGLVAATILLVLCPQSTDAAGALEDPTGESQAPPRRSLPLGAGAWAKYGYEAPLPFGASLGVMMSSQSFVLDGIRVEGRPVEAFAIDSARGTNNMLMPKIDVWLLPFLDVYVFGGFMQGTMNLNVVLYDLPLVGDRNLPLEFEFDGASLGGGATLAGGYRWIFAMLDGSYAKVDLSTFDSRLDMFMASARLGALADGGAWQAMFWAGGMYQDLDQTLQGELRVAEGAEPLVTEVDTGVRDPWNMIIGSRLQAGPRLALIVETGFLGRRQLFANLEYRF